MPKANSDNPFENFIISISNAVKLNPSIFLKDAHPENNEDPDILEVKNFLKTGFEQSQSNTA
jgi:hypothetical protein